MSPCQAQNITRLWESEIYDLRSFGSKVSTTFLAFDDIYILGMYLPTKFHVNRPKINGVMLSQAFDYIFDI